MATERVSHGIVTGPRDDVVSVFTCVPSALSVNALDEPVVFSAHITTQTVPPTVSLLCGCVMKALTVLGGGGGGGGGGVARRATAFVVSFARVFLPTTKKRSGVYWDSPPLLMVPALVSKLPSALMHHVVVVSRNAGALRTMKADVGGQSPGITVSSSMVTVPVSRSGRSELTGT